MYMEYQPVEFEEVIHIESIVTVHYFQFARGYLFAGERHDFWEFVYMDKGSAEIGADGRRFLLAEGEAVFHRPGEFHTIWAGGDNPPDIVVFSFICRSQAIERFSGVCTSVDDDCKALIAQVIREARNSWENMLDTHYLQLVRRHDGVIGSEQIVRLSLEALLIGLLRSVGVGEAISGNSVIRAVRPGTQLGRKEYLEGLAKEIESWISAHLDKKITIEGLGGRFNISATSLKKLFRQRMGGGVNEYLSVKRHEAAKRFIRDGRVSMKAIAEKCGYGSVYYFSRKFSLMEGMTPSEYARSVKSKTGL
jgi:AraC-like DNA-binding protein